MKKLLSFAMVLALCLSGCGKSGFTAQDAADYVRGVLDQTYLGVFDEDYLERVGLTEEEARAGYETGLDVEYQYFIRYFEMEEQMLTEQTRSAITGLLADLYQQASYEVVPGEQKDEGYEVRVTVAPIDLIAVVAEKYMEDYCAEFAAKYADADPSQLSSGEVDAFWLSYENDWAVGIVDLFREHEGELGHLEKRSLTVTVAPDEKGVYTLSDADFAGLDALILAYSN